MTKKIMYFVIAVELISYIASLFLDGFDLTRLLNSIVIILLAVSNVLSNKEK